MASTNKTTHYELSQYIGTDKPTYLVDYNQDMTKIDTGIYDAQSLASVNETSIGTLSNLTTTAKNDLVSAINEVNSETSGIGNLSNLTTTAKTDLVSAVNEVNSETSGIGVLADLTTTAKTDLVSAVNEVNGNIGSLSSLTTADKSSVVNAVNEVNVKTNTIGVLSNLETDDKTSIVSAINEIVDGDMYSTTAHKTDKIYKGKKVYRKVIEYNKLATNTSLNLTIAHGVTGYDKFWIDYGTSFIESPANFVVLPLSEYDSPTDFVRCYLDPTNINVNLGSVYTTFNLIFDIVVEWTIAD